MSGASWYYVDRQQQRLGPVTAADIAEAHRLGELDDASLVWREGLPAWAALGGHREELGISGPPAMAPAAPPAWGPPPARPTSKTLGCLLIGGAVGIGGLFALAILAAIAMPAYQDYVARAHLAAALADIRGGVVGYEQRLGEGAGGRSSAAAVGLPGTTARCQEIFTEGSFVEDGRMHRIACVVRGAPRVDGALIVLERQSAGDWTCIVSDVASALLPKGCESG